MNHSYFFFVCSIHYIFCWLVFLGNAWIWRMQGGLYAAFCSSVRVVFFSVAWPVCVGVGDKIVSAKLVDKWYC